MYSLRFTLLIGFLLISLYSTAQGLEQYQWKNRIILLKESNLDSDWLRGQVKRLQSNTTDLAEREVIVFILNNDLVYDIEKKETDLDANTIVQNYNLSDFLGLVLIGKDGGIKLKEEFIVNPKAIFGLIDSMPMRREEIKNR